MLLRKGLYRLWYKKAIRLICTVRRSSALTHYGHKDGKDQKYNYRCHRIYKLTLPVCVCASYYVVDILVPKPCKLDAAVFILCQIQNRSFTPDDSANTSLAPF
ncbi:hypothetical protein JOB18_036978 [Solea senegalensis]|uniref:Uncharacterized protein n=1 Tax=Solea senegalensis TaxID=28829 RepID=A0AAV6SGS8_SOLSE|nr:hypothetical protein JOB18_036978 [Solea senegalensis]